MNGWVRLGIAVSALWALFLLGAVRLSFRPYTVWDYLGSLVLTLSIFWLVAYVVVALVTGSFQRKEKGNESSERED